MEARREPWLRRSATDRYLSGLAGGVGQRLQFDPLLLRVGLVGATTFLAYAGENLHPFVLVPYFLAWALIPPAQGRSLLARFREREAIQELLGAFVLLVIGILVLADTDYAVAVGLGAIALALFSDRGRNNLTTPPVVGPTDPGASAEASGLEGSRGLVFGRSLNIGQRATRLFERDERPARREPALWPLTLSLLVLLGIVSILIDRFTEPGMDPRIFLNLALVAIGSVLMLSVWRGRARVTILWALVLLPLWIAYSVADVGRFAGEGTSLNVVTSGDLLSPDLAYAHGYGELTVDFRQVDLADGSETTVAVDLTAGRAVVIVPGDVTIKVQGKVGLGGYNVQSPPFWFHNADMVNGRIDRTFSALGVACFTHEQSEEGLIEMARRSGLTVAGNQNVVDVIAAAGFDEPRFAYSGQTEEWFANDQDELRLTDVDYFTVQSTNEGLLCAQQDPPANPATLTIEPTIGIGRLEISRVEVS